MRVYNRKVHNILDILWDSILGERWAMFWKRKLLGGQKSSESSGEYWDFGYVKYGMTTEQIPLASYGVSNDTVEGIKVIGDFSGIVSTASDHCFDGVWSYSGEFDSVEFPDLIRADSDYAFANAFRETQIESISFPKLESIGSYSFSYFNEYATHNRDISRLNFPALKTIGAYGMEYAFYRTEIGTDVSFPALTTIGNYGMQYAFYDVTITGDISFPKLESIGNYGMYYCFETCNLKANTVIEFPKLTTIGTYGFYYAFARCDDIVEVNFPALTTAGVSITGTTAATNPFYRAFYSCTGITELHFPSSFSTYSSYLTKAVLFGGTSSAYCNANLQILFDL